MTDQTAERPADESRKWRYSGNDAGVFIRSDATSEEDRYVTPHEMAPYVTNAEARIQGLEAALEEIDTLTEDYDIRRIIRAALEAGSKEQDA